MLVAVSDTHAKTDHRLVGRTRSAVEEADLVVHAGDFTTEVVLESFREVAGSFRAVHGNRDTPAVTDRLPETLTLTYGGARIVVTHRQRGGDTGLAMLGRERGADLVVHGHTHRPRVTEAGPVTLLNPGSHASPRGAPPSHAELDPDGERLAGRLVTVDGDVLERFRCQIHDQSRTD
ncbi:MAG: metallophosphoesterase [Haloferacaceae archaeon]